MKEEGREDGDYGGRRKEDIEIEWARVKKKGYKREVRMKICRSSV